MKRVIHGEIIPDFKDSNGKWVKSICVNYVKSKTKAYVLFSSIRMRTKIGGNYQKRATTYAGSEVSENFKDFQYFTSWCQSQVNYGLPNMDLDKDLLVGSSKIYSESTCVFIPHSLNVFFIFSDKIRGELALGVVMDKGRFTSHCGHKLGKRIWLGSFSTELEAHRVYVNEKERQARIWYERCKSGEVVVDPRVTERLRTWTVPEKYLMPELLAERRNSVV